MKKQGPCHCGTNSTPLWRNGPAEKPVLCNACGSRYRIRGTLANYAPKHAQIQQPIPPPKRFKINRPSSKKPKYKSIANLYTSIPYSTCPDNIDCRARVKATSSDSMMSLPRTSCSDDEVEEHDQGNSDLQIGGSGHVSFAKMVRRQEPSADVGAVSEARVSTKGGFTSVKIPQRLLNQRIQQCSNSLIGELLLEKGDPPYELHELKQRLNKVWAIEGSWQLISLGRGCFHIFLTSAAAKERLLEIGTLSLQPGTFSVHPWQPDFNPHEQKPTNALVWVRFFGLPLEYWDASILACISKGIGQFVRVDKATLEAEFGHYARVLIDVDLSSSIPLTIGVEKEGKQLWIDLEYENLPKVCKFCTSVGHSRTECRQNNFKDAPKHENHTRVIQKKGKVHYVKKSVARQTEATNGQVSTQQNLQVENERGTVNVCHSFNPNGSPHRAGVAQATVPVAQVVKRLREDLQITREELNPPSYKSCSLGDAQGLKLIVDLSGYNLQGFKDK